EDSAGQTALERLCYSTGNVKAFKFLVSYGAKIINHVDKKHAKTTLMIAAIYGHKDLVRELLDSHDVDITVQTEYGYNAEHFASAGGHISIVDLLRAKQKKGEGENEGESETTASRAANARQRLNQKYGESAIQGTTSEKKSEATKF
ncbi:hypothetical protein HK096_005224, partial [Nowakowskiella sp. JEL0078]